MIVSDYTFLFDDKNKYYAYNALTNALLELDVDIYHKLASCYRNKEQFVLPEEDNETFDELKSNHILVENQTDEFLIYKSIILGLRACRTSMHLTLAPTMDCCFRCHYCFEQHKEPGKMTEEVMNAIIKHIQAHNELKSLNLTWFGGEPLMAIDEIERFYEKLTPLLNGLQFNSNIITTAYHINRRTIQVLKKAQVKRMQITLDGNRETHNKVKFTPECDDCFTRVIENIDLLAKEYPELHIVIRVNLTLDNAKEYAELQSFILNRYKGNRQIAIAPAFVLDRNGGCSTANQVKSNLFNAKDYARYILQLAADDIDSPYIRYPGRFFTECAIRNNVAIAFDPQGYAYKCWELIGNNSYAIGQLDAEGHIVNINTTVLNRQLYGADQLEDKACQKCRYLPLCNGGCPIQRIQNEFENGKNICCTYYRNHIREFMLEHIRRK